MLKSKIWEEFFLSSRYSDCKTVLPSTYNLGVNVKSLFSDITLKYGICKAVPKVLVSENLGIKKPDCLLTVGSGWKNLGKYTTGLS